VHWLDYNLMVIDGNNTPEQRRPHSFASASPTILHFIVGIMAGCSSSRGQPWNFDMLYVLLCYHSEDVVFSSAATTLRRDRDQPVVIDGPFAETKEQLLGFFIIDCESLEEAIEITRELGEHNPGGAYEIRPVRAFWSAGREGT
jgi:hypothetical protein